MFVIILQILEAGLSIWSSIEKTKYSDQMIALKTQYYAELNKPETERSDALLDDLTFSIKTLALAWAQEAKS